jgi:hypothetical protein
LLKSLLTANYEFNIAVIDESLYGRFRMRETANADNALVLGQIDKTKSLISTFKVMGDNINLLGLHILFYSLKVVNHHMV